MVDLLSSIKKLIKSFPFRDFKYVRLINIGVIEEILRQGI